MRPITIIILASILVGCASGGGTATGESAPATTPVITHHPSGRIWETGQVVTGTTMKTGHWTSYFDAEDAARQWEGDYAEGIIDPTWPWTEWNADGSVRVVNGDR